MDREMEISRKDEIGSVIVGGSFVYLKEGVCPMISIDIKMARMIAQAIDDYDRAIAALGYAA